MSNKSYTATIEVAQSPKEVFDHIIEVSRWWSKDFEGNSAKLNDEFIIHHFGAHYSKQKLVEVIPGRKVVWLVTDSKLNWLEKDKHEWTNTKMVFDITPNGGKTLLHFTHEGLVPEKECYTRCVQGWNMVIKDWLFNFITADKSTVIFGNHSSVLVPQQDRGNIRKFYCDVLGGKVMRSDPERDFVRLGGNFYIAFLYGDVPDESTFLRSARSIWLEIKSDNVEEISRKILASGLVRKLEVPDPHLYFQAPGGQCLRLVGIEEDLSFYEGAVEGPNMAKVKEAIKNL